MKRPPIDPKQTIFADGLGWFIVWVGLLVGGVTIGMQAWAIQRADAHWQTMTFSVLCLSQLGLAFTIRSRRESAFSIGLFSNKPMLGALVLTFGLQMMVIYVPFFNGLFRTQPLTWVELGITLAVSSIVFWAVEAQKLVGRRREAAPEVVEPVVAGAAPAAVVVPAKAEPARVEPVVAEPATPAPVLAAPAPAVPMVAAPVVAEPALAATVVATPAEPTVPVVAELAPAAPAPVESAPAAPTAPAPVAVLVAAPVVAALPEPMVAVFMVAVAVVAAPVVAAPPASPPVPEQEGEPARNTIGHEAEPVEASPPKS